MSAINGDKARFHRQRKQKIARRQRNQPLLKTAAAQHISSAPAAAAKPKEKTA
ncbi:MAG TPA: hypothetical protein VGF08_11580 [Terriglobales bacterium]|jgi:hypothetical protein